jgi:HEAT repeat protein
LEPVRRYVDQLRKGAGPSRLMAVLGLGDTADAAAFEALLIALSDRWASVRSAAVQAVRRLVLSGLADEYRNHPVRQRLAELLTDDNHRVRVDAARTLCLFGDEALVTDALSKVSWWQRKWKRELEAALRGDVPPLQKMWIGDQNV